MAEFPESVGFSFYDALGGHSYVRLVSGSADFEVDNIVSFKPCFLYVAAVIFNVARRSIHALMILVLW